MISSGSSAVSNRPLKNSSAAILRLEVMIGRAEAERRRRIVGVRIVVGDRAADGAAVAHRRIADHAGELRRAPEWLCCTTGEFATSACLRHGADHERAALQFDARSMPSIALRSTMLAGDASRCFMVGSRVWPPASSLGSSSLAEHVGRLTQAARAVDR